MVKYFTLLLYSFHGLIMAQSLDFGTPEKLTNNINSEYEESMPLLSSDGTTLYFTRFMSPDNSGGQYAGTDVWSSRYDVTTFTWGWADNKRLTINTQATNALIGMNPKGDVMYFQNTSATNRVNGIFFSKKFSGVWSKPELIAMDGLSTQGFLGIYVSPDFDVIFLSMKGEDSRGEEDLYVSVKNSAGTWSKPKNLGPTINTTGFEISPFLSQDKKRLYFSSNGFGGQGDADIYYTDRLYTSSWETWSTPRNLGDKVNSKAFDAYFSTYGDSIAFFTSNRSGKLADIYSAKVLGGSEELGFRQQYLTKEEMDAIIGPNVSRKISFPKTTIDLDGGQKELLWFIANKILQRKAINIQLSVLEEDDTARTTARVNAIADHLKLAGIESFRILLPGKNYIRKKSDSGGAIELLLFQ